MSPRARQRHPRVEAVLEYVGFREPEDAASRRVDWLVVACPALLGIAASEALGSPAPEGVGFVVTGLLVARVMYHRRRETASLRQGG